MVLNPLRSTPTPGGCGGETAVVKQVCVKQGPEWVAGLLVNPPGWVQAVLIGIAFGAVAVGLYVHLEMGMDKQDARQMLASVVLVGSCGAGALLFRELGWFPYVVDVFGGWLVGAAVGVALARRIRTDDPYGGEAADPTEVQT